MPEAKNRIQIFNQPKAPKINLGLFASIKDYVLGKKYSLNVIFVTPRKIQTLNNQYRKKDYATDILSFPLEKNSGEIYLCFSIIKKKSKEFDRTPLNYLDFLFIHGVLHLKGMQHGGKMESEEKCICQKFEI